MKIIPEEITKKQFYKLVYNEVKYLIINNTKSTDNDNDEYPFTLKLVNRTGKYCSRCFWSKGCSGCSIDNTSDKLYCVTNENNIAIDWDEGIELNFNKINLKYTNENDNSSNELNNDTISNNSDLNIYDCLNDFTNETQLDKESEAYCSNV